MNKRNEIDQLFSNRLEGAKVTPSAAAWSQLENNLQKNKKKPIFWFYRVAAAILLIMVSIFTWNVLENKQDDAFSLAKAPNIFRNAPYPGQFNYESQSNELNTYVLEQLAISEKNKNVVQPTAVNPHLSNTTEGSSAGNTNSKIAQVKRKKIVVAQKEELENRLITLENKPDKHIVSEQVDITSKVIVQAINSPELPTTTIRDTNEQLPAVSITYLGGNETTKKVNKNKKKNSRFSLKKVFKSARKLANGDLIADLRGAKDNLLGSGIKSGDD